MQNAIKIIATSALLVSALPVFSQNAPAADPRNVVQLSASGAVEVQQDELILTLGASADGRDASSVQAQLRQVVDAALTVQSTLEEAPQLHGEVTLTTVGELLRWVLAPALLAATGDDAEQARVLPRIAAGSAIVTLAHAESRSPLVPEHISTRARRCADGWTLTGAKNYVLDGVAADLIYVLAATDDGPAVFAVDRGADGLTAATLTTVDATRKLTGLAFADTPARLVGEISSGRSAFTAALEAGGIALTSEQAGGAQRAVRMAADYAGTRFQFARAIGSFQAVKHMCADMLTDAESAVSAARHVAAAGHRRTGSVERRLGRSLDLGMPMRCDECGQRRHAKQPVDGGKPCERRWGGVGCRGARRRRSLRDHDRYPSPGWNRTLGPERAKPFSSSITSNASEARSSAIGSTSGSLS